METLDRQAYLSFKLNEELFAVSTFKVLEVLEKQHITSVPKAPEYVLGIINFRGEVLPVIDARKKFHMPERAADAKFVIIVLDLSLDNNKYLLGAVADSVKDVIEISKTDIKDVPKMGLNYNTEFITGMVHFESSFIMMLDIDKVFSSEDVHFVTQHQTESSES